MKIAIMQPYLFPYIGYYQLMGAVEHFVILDDVTFIKQGWINRNRILADGKPLMFSVPLSNAGSHVKIRDVTVSDSEYARWRTKFLRTLGLNYHRAPRFEAVMPLIDDALPPPRARFHIRDAATKSLRVVMRHLGLPFAYSFSSEYEKPAGLRGSERVLSLCRRLSATAYYNAPGGEHLYDRESFDREGIELRFLAPRELAYPQLGTPFVPWLSILDVLMFNPPDAVRAMLREYDLR